MRAFLSLCLFAFSAVAHSQIKLFEEPLKPLAITLESNFKLINTPNQTGAEIGRTDLGEGMIEPIYFRSPGTLSYKSDAGQTIVVPVDIEPRGMRRRQNCEWKPLDVKFKTPPTDELMANAAKSLEMSTHCQGQTYTQALYNEYFSYRTKVAFGTPTFRVRMANITYIDNTKTFPTVTFPAIFLEAKSDMAKRFGAKVLKLTPEEEAVPFTEQELADVAWGIRYGDSYIKKFALRARIYKKFNALYSQVPLALRQIFLDHMGLQLISHYDIDEQYLVNIFPIQYGSGAVQMVQYDFDEASVGGGVNNTIVYQVFQKHFQDLGIELADYKRTRTLAQIEADKKEVLDTLYAVIDNYDKSGLEQELKAFKNPNYDAKSLRDALRRSLTELKGIVTTPEIAFAFLK